MPRELNRLPHCCMQSLEASPSVGPYSNVRTKDMCACSKSVGDMASQLECHAVEIDLSGCCTCQLRSR